MTAPDTNVEKQAKRHKGPLIGIVAVLIAAGIFAVFFAGSDDLNEDASVEATEEAADSN